MRRRASVLVVVLGVAAGILLGGFARTSAGATANAYSQRTRARTDQPVAFGQVSRTWMWGPEAFTAKLQEPYAESPGGQGSVQSFDKARMEITQPNGLLGIELITGRLQTGYNSLQQRSAATVNVAADADDPRSPTSPTFGGFYVVDADIQRVVVFMSDD